MVLMKILDTEILFKNFIYRQVKREGQFAIYSQAFKNKPDKIIAYEVIIIQKHNGYELAGVKYPPAEFYPGTNQWGKAGWTISGLGDKNLEKALDKMRQVMEHESMKADKRAIRELSERGYEKPEQTLNVINKGLKHAEGREKTKINLIYEPTNY